MNAIALKMLLGDRGKFLGLVFGVAFAALLITQQASIFIGLMLRTGSTIVDAAEVDVWVMDPSVEYLDTVFPLRDSELERVRGVPGVAWAVPFFRANAPVRTVADGETPGGLLQGAILLGLDDASLVGAPKKVALGSLEDLRLPDAVAIDRAGYLLLWPGEALRLGRALEINDQRAVVVAITDAAAPFTTNPLVHTRYANAVRYTNQGRGALSYVLVRATDGLDRVELAARIAAHTGLQARTSGEFHWQTVRYYLANTGIPVNFGTVVVLGIVVGIAVVGLLFNTFVLENIQQFAALKAIGVGNRRLVGMVLLQAAVVGAVGYSFGLLFAAVFFEAGANAIALRGFRLPWQVALGTGLLTAAIMVASTALGLRRVLFVDPATVFRG